MDNDFLLIGIDGGATKVSGWTVVVEEQGRTFSLGKLHAEKLYNEVNGFVRDFQPIDIDVQLSEMESGAFNITDDERQQASVYVEACSQIIENIVKKSNIRRVLVGIGLPGLKTKDQRGVAAMANGPRIINYCNELETRLADSGTQLISPIAHLGSDAFYCGMGEEYAREGKFRSVKNSYYLGGGTGAADALKLEGSLISLDDTKEWFVKTWEMKSGEGYSMERYVSARGVQSIYSELSGIPLSVLDSNGIYSVQIEEKASQGEEKALETYRKVSYYLALLLYERITTLYAGWQGIFSFVNPVRQAPSSNHSYKGKVFDSIVFGQRLGDLFRYSRGDDVLWNPFFNHLSEMIMESDVLDDRAKSYYCHNGRFVEALLKISDLRTAPALGAGIDAYLIFKGK